MTTRKFIRGRINLVVASDIPVAFTESILAGHIAITILKDQNRGLVDFQGQVTLLRIGGMIDIGLCQADIN